MKFLLLSVTYYEECEDHKNLHEVAIPISAICKIEEKAFKSDHSIIQTVIFQSDGECFYTNMSVKEVVEKINALP